MDHMTMKYTTKLYFYFFFYFYKMESNFFSVPLPCIVSDWSNWSAPDASGVRFRVRYMIRPALNGGKECQDLIVKSVLTKPQWNQLLCSE
jgi:hypothetical protein